MTLRDESRGVHCMMREGGHQMLLQLRLSVTLHDEREVHMRNRNYGFGKMLFGLLIQGT